MTNFEFLKKHHSNLYGLIRESEINIFTDPDTSLYKLRKFGEEITNMIFVYEKIMSFNADSQYSNLQILEEENILSQKELSQLHLIRINGNKSVHENINSADIVEKTLKAAFDISTYFYKNYCNREFEMQKFNCYSRNNLDENNDVFITEEISSEDRVYFDEIMTFIFRSIELHIIETKLNGWGSIIDIREMSFMEFYEYYIETIDKLSQSSLEYMQALIQVKIIARKKLRTTNGKKINQELALMLYLKTHWAKKGGK